MMMRGAGSSAAGGFKQLTPTDLLHRPTKPLRHSPPPPTRTPPSNLRGMDLRGTIPADQSIWNDLYGVRSMDLSENPYLVGSLPDAIGYMPHFYTM
jgi:hypothetical protein